MPRRPYGAPRVGCGANGTRHIGGHYNHTSPTNASHVLLLLNDLPDCIDLGPSSKDLGDYRLAQDESRLTLDLHAQARSEMDAYTVWQWHRH